MKKQTTQESNTCKAPPIGIMPLRVFDSKQAMERAVSLVGAITRHVEACKTIDINWVYELGERLEDIQYGSRMALKIQERIERNAEEKEQTRVSKKPS